MLQTGDEVNVAKPEFRNGAHDAVSIQEALAAIVRSAPFRTTRQCQEFLRYVVEHTLAGEDQNLRERIIGVEVFGRKPDYDTSEDPVVRIRAADVRRRLAQFYQESNGNGPKVRIGVPAGSYRATFAWAGAEKTEENSVSVLHDAPAILQGSARDALALALPLAVDDPRHRLRLARRRVSTRLLGWLAVSMVVLLAASTAYVYRPSQRAERSFKQFWAPITKGSRPLLICMGSNAVYQYSHEFMVQYLRERHLENAGTETYVDLPPDSPIMAGDVHRARDSFVALGDVAAVSQLVAMLTHSGKPFQQRFPPDISFAELQNTPTILIGGFNNALTIALSKDLRFVLTRNSRVEDRKDPTRSWAVQFNGDARDSEDYAIISRLLDSKSGGPLMILSGIGQFGTQAAAEFASNPAMISRVVESAPPRWADKNMQIVLHIRVINFRPVSTEVVATEYW